MPLQNTVRRDGALVEHVRMRKRIVVLIWLNPNKKNKTYNNVCFCRNVPFSGYNWNPEVVALFSSNSDAEIEDGEKDNPATAQWKYSSLFWQSTSSESD